MAAPSAIIVQTPPLAVSVRTAAELFDYEPDTMRRLLKKQEVPTLAGGRRIAYTDLLNLVDSLRDDGSSSRAGDPYDEGL